MKLHLVITAIADDRPGVVKSLSDTIKSSGGNWTESRMSRLGGKFAGIVRVDVSPANRDSLIAALESLGNNGIRIAIEQTDKPNEAPGAINVSIKLVGNERPGIVEEISAILAARHINVEDLSTWVDSAPMSADELFHASIVAGLPAAMNRQELQSALEGLSDDLTVEFDEPDRQSSR